MPFLVQGIFVNQGLNPRLLHCRWILHLLSHQGSPLADIQKPNNLKGNINRSFDQTKERTQRWLATFFMLTFQILNVEEKLKISLFLTSHLLIGIHGSLQNPATKLDPFLDVTFRFTAANPQTVCKGLRSSTLSTILLISDHLIMAILRGVR